MPSKTKTALCLATALAALAAPATAPAAVRLVDDDAQANFGSCETTACASIPYAVGQAQPGDTVRIAAGSYTVAGLTTAKTLHFEGAGADATKVTSTVGTPLTLTAGGSVKDLRLQGGASYGIGRSGLRVTGAGTPGSDAADLTRLVVRSGSGNDDHGDDTEPALDVDGSIPAAGSLWVEGDELTLHGADESSSNGPGVIARGRHAGVVLKRSKLTGHHAAVVEDAVLFLMRSQATVDPSLDYGVIVDGGELQVWHSRVTGPTAINVRGNVEAGAAWVHDSLITANDPQGGTAITASSGLEVTNVTVRRSTLASVVKDNPHALNLHHYAGAAPTTATLDSVLVEPGLDLRAQGAGATIAATRSWMAQPTAVDGANVPASGSGAFRSGDPKVDADLRPLPGSPLIDGGMSLGGIETDVDGRDRNSDGDGDGVRTPDIGAYEAAHIATSAPSGAGAGTAQVTAAPPPTAPVAATPVVSAADRVAPVLRGSRLLKPAFTARKGTRLRFTLTEAGRVGVRVDRLVRISGRTRVRPAGTTTLAGKAGANDVAFRGRLGGKTLRAGRYRLTLTATDAAGNRSAPVRLSFRVKR